MTKRVLFVNPPSYKGFDGGAGSRYQAKREVRSFWYPTWLAQAAVLCPGSRLLDAPVEDMSLEAVVQAAKSFDVAVIYTSTPGYINDALLAERLRQEYPSIILGMVGPHATVLPDDTLEGCKALNFVARGEFDYTIFDIANGKPMADIDGLSYRNGATVIHNSNRALIRDMDALPSVLDVYKRDLSIEKYFIGYLLHPYLSLYTGRGCPGRCTFCLWPQTIGGRQYRTRSPRLVVEEMKRAKRLFPTVKEFFFDDDTFTADFKRTEAIAVGLKELDISWSCSARANVPERTLSIMKEAGLRCIMVGIESGNDAILKNIKKGITTDQARAFLKNCRKLNIVTHATFVVGLPGETRETIKQSISFAKEIDPDTLQVSIASPYPGTELYQQALDNGWLVKSDLVSQCGIQQASLQYQDLTRQEIFDSVETFYHQFYLRPKPVLRILWTMMRDKDICKRRLREAWEFFGFMHARKQSSHKDRPA